tara:strand:+ start:196 stop:678 length:483 start_codon:yes stop_codon:yes gene_type:complete
MCVSLVTYKVPGAIVAGKIVDNRTIRAIVPSAMIEKVNKNFTEISQFDDLHLDLIQIFLGKFLDVGTTPPRVLIKRQKRSAIFDAETKTPGSLNKAQFVNLYVSILPITVLGAWSHNQTDIFVVADCLDRQVRHPRCLTYILETAHFFLTSCKSWICAAQ